MADKLKIRDFIYLDVEKMKSIFSQLEKGLLQSSTEQKGTDKGISGKVGSKLDLKIAGLNVEAIGEYIRKNSETETKTLHDHMYNYIENKLKMDKQIFLINKIDDIDILWESGKLTEMLPNTSFILVKGHIILDDYERLEELLRNTDEVNNAIDYLNEKTDYVEEPIDRNRRALKKKSDKMTNKKLKSLAVVIKTFYANRLVVKVIPFLNKPYLCFVGPLNRESLREKLDNLIFKYGTAPTSEWWVFGQISSIPLTGYPNLDETDITESILDSRIESNLEFEIFFDGTFKFLRDIDNKFSAKFPLVTITPIAIYRSE